MGFGNYSYVIPDGINPNIYNADGTLLLQLALGTINETKIKGRNAAGTDLYIYANSVNALPYLKMLGNSGIYFYGAAGSYFIIKDGANESFRFTYAANVSTMRGGTVSGDSHILKANNLNDYPFIQLIGDGAINLYGKGDIGFYDEATFLGQITSDKTLKLPETTTPTAHVNTGQFYTKNDNKAYFQDGAGAEHELAYV